MEKNKEFLNLILNRRSCRSFRPEPVPSSALAAVVEAGRFAPSAMNLQLNRFYIITDPQILAEITRVVSDNMRSFAGKDCRYGAPALILVTNKKTHPCALQDASCAMENMMLAASALGLGSCWTNQPFHLREKPAMVELLTSIGMGEDEFPCAALSLGLPDGELPSGRLERTGNAVVWVGEK